MGWRSCQPIPIPDPIPSALALAASLGGGESDRAGARAVTAVCWEVPLGSSLLLLLAEYDGVVVVRHVDDFRQRQSRGFGNRNDIF